MKHAGDLASSSLELSIASNLGTRLDQPQHAALIPGTTIAFTSVKLSLMTIQNGVLAFTGGFPLTP